MDAKNRGAERNRDICVFGVTLREGWERRMQTDEGRSQLRDEGGLKKETRALIERKE